MNRVTRMATFALVGWICAAPPTAEAGWILSFRSGVAAPQGEFGDVFKSSPLFGGSVGYASSNVEGGLEASYTHADPSERYQEALGLVSGSAGFTQTHVGLFLQWGVPLDSAIRPYVGLGFGVYYLEDQYEDPSLNGNLDAHDTSPGAHADLGMMYSLGPAVGLALSVRYSTPLEDNSFYSVVYERSPYVTFYGGLRLGIGAGSHP